MSEERFALGGFVAWFAITGAWWALAFAPLPVAEAWLASARTVCFGTLPNGLPEPWGWMLLLLAPAAILAFPVGFVGAAESKDALIAAGLEIPWLTLRGRRGGSALAAAAVNALMVDPT